MKITEKMIIDHFDVRSFHRGDEYQTDGHVIDAIKTDNLLWGKVAGSLYDPYRVKVRMKGKEIEAECSCPVGTDCKHAVALLLEYIRNPDSFADMNMFHDLLEKKNRDELIGLIKELVQLDPGIIRELGFVMEKKKSLDGKVNMDAIRGRIDFIISGELNYHNIFNVVDEMNEVMKIGERLEESSNWYLAGDVYLSIVEGVFQAYREGADDSSGSLGGLSYECVESFCRCVEEIDDINTDNLLERVLSLFLKEDYGLGTDTMILSLVKQRNLNVIEGTIKNCLKNLDEKKSDMRYFSYSYKRQRMRRLLAEVYSKLEMKEDELNILFSDLKTKEDFIDAANALLKYDRYGEALDTIRKAPKEFVVKMKYFEILDDIPKKEINRYWNITEAAENAFKEPGPLSDHIEWDPYNRIRDIFQKADAVDDMIEMAERIIPRSETLAKMFLYEGYPEKAALVLEGNSKISGDIGISIGSMAWKQRKKDLAMKVTKLALARGLGFRKKLDPEDRRIIGELLKRTPEDELPALVSSFKMDGPLLKFIAKTLVPIRPDISHDLLDKNIERLDGEFVVKMIKDLENISPEISISLGVKAFEAFSGRSHIYYEVMIDMLKAVKPSYSRIHGTNGWDQYILEIKKRFKTKKKLVNMIDNM
jgi:hypothetical protein